MNSDEDTPCGMGCPIRRSRDHRSLASPPGFSQRATSFTASQCQGIHQMPLLALDPRRNTKGLTLKLPPHKTAAHRGKTPTPKRPHMKTLLGYTQALRPEPIRLGHMTNSLFTLQTTPPPGLSRTVSQNLLQTPPLSALLAQHLSRGRNFVATVVEVNGFEPMTSCLQSRRSPS